MVDLIDATIRAAGDDALFIAAKVALAHNNPLIAKDILALMSNPATLSQVAIYTAEQWLEKRRLDVTV